MFVSRFCLSGRVCLKDGGYFGAEIIGNGETISGFLFAEVWESWFNVWDIIWVISFEIRFGIG